MKISTIAVGEYQVNCFIIQGDSDQVLVIDPGEDAQLISAFLDKHNLTVAAYILTHGHMDHVSAVADLYDYRPAPIAIHPADAAWAFTETNQSPPFYGPPRPPKKIERQLQDTQEWNDAGLNYRIIATPGHTPGGICVHFPDANKIFTGDTLFAGSVGRTDLPGGNSRVLQKSLARLAKLDGATQVFPGHGPATTIAHENKTNFFMRGQF